MSTHNKSELMATFTDYDHNESPYVGPAIRFRIVDDIVFIYVGKLDEQYENKVGCERFEFDDAQSIGVDAQTLYEALGAMLRREDREIYDRARNGDLPADHSAWRITPTLSHVPAVRSSRA